MGLEKKAQGYGITADVPRKIERPKNIFGVILLKANSILATKGDR